MVQASHLSMIVLIRIVWCLMPISCALRRKRMDWKRELQLPFYDRVTDIDDLILNTFGFVIGYLLYLLTKSIRKHRRKPNESI